MNVTIGGVKEVNVNIYSYVRLFPSYFKVSRRTSY